MELIYTDESGTNYSNENGIFKDSPFIIYGALCINENKYFHLERLFVEVIKSYFSITDWRKNEIHGTNMWNLKDHFSSYSQDKIKEFFDEILQLIIKLDVSILTSFQKKSATTDKLIMKKEESYAIYCLLHLIENYLATLSNTGVIIADSKLEKEKSLFNKIFDQRSAWRTFPEVSMDRTIKSKYDLESRLCFLIDNIHYVDSKRSLFSQVIDIVLFIIMRVFTYEYFRVFKVKEAMIEKVPINLKTFKFFLNNILTTAVYHVTDNDVLFVPFKHKAEMLSHLENAFIIDHVIKGFADPDYFLKSPIVF